MGRRNPLARCPRLLGAILSGAVLAAALVAVPAASAVPPRCVDRPDVFPVADLRPGMKGTGWTVVEGRDPVSFTVEILGVLPDGIAPGIDFVLVQVSGRVIRQTGGIAFGFSGSPVYIRDRLVGSISYGFFAADQTVGGLTPAEAMLGLFDDPSSGGGTPATATAATPAVRPAPTVPLTRELRARAARAAGVPVGDFPSEAEQLRIPLAVSGLNGRAMDALRTVLDRSGLPFVPYRAGALRGTAPAGEPLGAGDAVGATVSAGDLTFAGVGTVTAVCGDLVVAFGHPFFWDGSTVMGMNAADVVTVVRDPSNLFGPFKVANLAEFHGTIDQDRLTGIRGVEGTLPAMVPVSSGVTNPDLGRFRAGQTQVIKTRSSFFPLLPFLAAFHLLLNQDVVFDRIGDGTVTLTFTIDGIGPSGEPFRLVRDNMHFSPFDASFESIFELFSYLERIQENPFGEVRFTGVSADSVITQRHLTARIRRVLSASSLRPELRERKRLPVLPGERIKLRVFLLPEGSTTEVPVDLRLRVPRDAAFGGSLVVRGGGLGACFFCVFDDGEEGQEPATFEDLLQELRTAEQNNHLVAELVVEPNLQVARRILQDRVILGQRSIEITVVG